MSAEVVRGLEAESDAPLRSGYVQALATWSIDEGAMARLEAGLHPFSNTSIYAFGQWDRQGPGLGLGARYDFSW